MPTSDETPMAMMAERPEMGMRFIPPHFSYSAKSEKMLNEFQKSGIFRESP